MDSKDILLIDDDIDDAELFAEALSSLGKGIKCLFQTDPVQAFECLKASKKLPDLLFLDINMPRLSGLDIWREIKKDPRLRHMDVILISSASEEVIRSLLPEEAIGKYMSKPCSYPAFLEQLRAITG